MSLQTSLEGRSFQALLNGLTKRLFFNEESFTNEFLIEQIYTSVDLEKAEIEAEIESFAELLSRGSQENWDSSKLESLIKSCPLSVVNKKLLVAFWGNERDRIHERMNKLSKWNRSFKQLVWRVDVKAASKATPEINEPVALFEFTSDSGHRSSRNSDVKLSRFEMNRGEVSDMLSVLEGIQKTIDEEKVLKRGGQVKYL